MLRSHGKLWLTGKLEKAYKLLTLWADLMSHVRTCPPAKNVMVLCDISPVTGENGVMLVGRQRDPQVAFSHSDSASVTMDSKFLTSLEAVRNPRIYLKHGIDYTCKISECVGTEIFQVDERWGPDDVWDGISKPSTHLSFGFLYEYQMSIMISISSEDARGFICSSARI